jgi:hypothetical protein
MGLDDEEPRDTKKYKFPYGDFRAVHRCTVLSAKAACGLIV